MKKILNLLVVILFPSLLVAQNPQYEIEGEMRKWHKITLTFNGPSSSETHTFNPFLHYRLQVTFRSEDKIYVVPGYFAADGEAAQSSAEGGNKWRVHFAPDQVGQWDFEVSFRIGNNIAVDPNPLAGEAGHAIDGLKGTFEVLPTDKRGRDLRAQGRLTYDRQHYLYFAETGQPFFKAGADAPENLLAYADFDGTFKTDGRRDDLVKTWDAHKGDWKTGDPTWQDGKGKALIGAINYLASKGMNAFSFLTLNIAGDDHNVFPYINYDTYERMDCSKLDQWEILFEHADHLGMFLHFKMSEDENQGLLDGGECGTQRKLYYRELMARFGHHLALNWNIGEENGRWHKVHKTPWQTTTQRLAMARYFFDQDPYHHHVVIHNGQQFYDILGPESKYTGISLQTNRPTFERVHDRVIHWRELSTGQRKPLAIAVDEPGDAQHSLLPDAENPEHNLARQNALWGAFMGGAWGIEWYFGYQHAHSDLTCQDWRSRDLMWDQSRHCIKFFQENNLPIWAMQPSDDLTENDDYVFALPGSIYIIYQKMGKKEQTTIDGVEGNFSVRYYNPRTGEYASASNVESRGKLELDQPPSDPDKDWVIIATRDFTSMQPSSAWSRWDRFLNGKELNDDSQGVFQPLSKTELRISGAEDGYVISKQEIGDFHLKLQYKWGQEGRGYDSGIFFNAQTQEGHKTWPKSIEFQLKPGQTADLWLIDGIEATHKGYRTARNQRFVACPANLNAENATGEWNDIEIISYGGQIWYLLNGFLVNEVKGASVRQGKLFLQSIGSEIFYRNIEIKEL